MVKHGSVSIVVSIPACHVGDLGSIPRRSGASPSCKKEVVTIAQSFVLFRKSSLFMKPAQFFYVFFALVGNAQSQGVLFVPVLLLLAALAQADLCPGLPCSSNLEAQLFLAISCTVEREMFHDRASIALWHGQSRKEEAQKAAGSIVYWKTV